jgi:hypothetical protein
MKHGSPCMDEVCFATSETRQTVSSEGSRSHLLLQIKLT